MSLPPVGVANSLFPARSPADFVSPLFSSIWLVPSFAISSRVLLCSSSLAVPACWRFTCAALDSASPWRWEARPSTTSRLLDRRQLFLSKSESGAGMRTTLCLGLQKEFIFWPPIYGPLKMGSLLLRQELVNFELPCDRNVFEYIKAMRKTVPLGDEDVSEMRVKKLLTRIALVVSNKDSDIDSYKKYKKIQKILGISESQLEEFAKFKRNEKKLLKMFGTFVDYEMENGVPIDLKSALSIIDEKNFDCDVEEVAADGTHKQSNKKITNLLGITKENLEAYRSYQSKMPKLRKVLGEFIQLDNPESFNKIRELEKVVLINEEII